MSVDLGLQEQMRKMKEKRDEQMKEIEKMYDKCLRMHFQMAKDKLDLTIMWKSIENMKMQEANVKAALAEILHEVEQRRE